MCLWHLSVNPLWPGTLFIPVSLRLLILPLSLFGSMMMMLTRHSRRTFLNEAFIRNAKSYCRTLPTLTFSLSYIVGDGSHCVTSRSHVLFCADLGVLLQYTQDRSFSTSLFHSRSRYTHPCHTTAGFGCASCP